MRHPVLVALACAIGFAAAAPAAPPEGKGRPDKGSRNAQHDHDDRDGAARQHRLVTVAISAGDARRVAEQFDLVGYSSLPPGIRKNLARGKPLPPGLARQVAPQPMVERLPRYDGYEWRVAGADLVLVSIANAVIAEVLTDVFR